MSTSLVPNSNLAYQHGRLVMDGVDLSEIANNVGTPCFVYSAQFIRDRVTELQAAFAGTETHIHYSVKANSNLSLLRLFTELGCGFDIVSAGELTRVVAAGADPSSVVFSGVGKSTTEIDYALKLGIGCFNIESTAEMTRISQRAKLLGKTASIAIRVNPDVDPQTHPYISTGLKQNKFGVTPEEALDLYSAADADEHLLITGIDCHIGSQINSSEPLLQALTNLLELVDQLKQRNIELEHIDLGGGMGITYKDETALDVHAYGASVQQILGHRKHAIYLEPGRSLTANAGTLLTRVEYLKPARSKDAPSFAVVDAAMNDLIRPALYEAWHEILPLDESAAAETDSAPQLWDVVGPVCESGDFLARGRPLKPGPDSLLAVASCGAYGMVQASNYNSRPRACEVMVDDGAYRVVRRRETIEDQLRLEMELES